MRTKFLFLRFSLKLEVFQKTYYFLSFIIQNNIFLLKIFELITDNFYQKIIKNICCTIQNLYAMSHLSYSRNRTRNYGLSY